MIELLGFHDNVSKRRVSGLSEKRNPRGYIANEPRPVNKKTTTYRWLNHMTNNT
jgi:hypothetical protein